jgi:uncharacterized membrane protein
VKCIFSRGLPWSNIAKRSASDSESLNERVHMNTVMISAFIIGIACALRAIVGLAAVSWAASCQHLALEGTWLSFLGKRVTPFITSFMALGELVTDKLPKTPSRLVPPQFGARVAMGALSGTAVGLSQGHFAIGLIAGIVGSVVGTFGGFKGRGLVAKSFGRDLPAALLEDVIAIALAFVALC